MHSHVFLGSPRLPNVRYDVSRFVCVAVERHHFAEHHFIPRTVTSHALRIEEVECPVVLVVT